MISLNMGLYSMKFTANEDGFLNQNQGSDDIQILIRFITLKNNWINPCMKTEGKCNESVNNEFKIMRESDSLHQIMKVSK